MNTDFQFKQISGEGHTSYLAYSTDTHYKLEDKQLGRQDSNYYTTLKYRQKLTNDFDRGYYESVFGYKQGKVRGVW